MFLFKILKILLILLFLSLLFISLNYDHQFIAINLTTRIIKTLRDKLMNYKRMNIHVGILVTEERRGA